ncbi:hypothetical protein JRD95_00253 [Rickettsia parkeri]|nr:hypothetical protein JRD95_00253 [Rickettsia parkeri]
MKKGIISPLKIPNIDYNNACYDVWRKILDEKTCIATLENLNNKIVRLTSWLKENKDLYLVDTKYVNYTKEIKDAVNNNAEIIHIKNIDQKNYNIMTPYDGEVQISGIKELICHMYGVIGIIGSLPVLYKEDKNIIRAVAPRRNSHNEHSSQSPYND